MNQISKSLSFKPKNISMGRQQCKKHHKHRQSPGVCSLCLSEKLSKVSFAGAAARPPPYYHSSTSSSVSSTSYESSYASSNGGSPLRAAVVRHRRIVSNVYDDTNEENGRLFFSKSKSMAHVNKLRLLDDNKAMLKKKEKKDVNGVGKIWSNLLRLRRVNHDQKRVKVEDIHRKISSATTMVLAS